MKKQKLKLHSSRWLGGAAAAALLATAVHAQTELNIEASGIYQGGNTLIGTVAFTNGSPFTEHFTLNLDSQTVSSAYETISIDGNTYVNNQSSGGLTYGSSPTIGTVLQVEASTTSDPLTFGFDIRFNQNLFDTPTTTLTETELSTIFTAFQNNDPRIIWGSGSTDIYANQQDYGSTIGTIQPAPEPTTLALAGLGGMSLLLFRRRK